LWVSTHPTTCPKTHELIRGIKRTTVSSTFLNAYCSISFDLKIFRFFERKIESYTQKDEDFFILSTVSHACQPWADSPFVEMKETVEKVYLREFLLFVNFFKVKVIIHKSYNLT
jgi:hypothetical protein